jgi:hypothetical protein
LPTFVRWLLLIEADASHVAWPGRPCSDLCKSCVTAVDSKWLSSSLGSRRRLRDAGCVVGTTAHVVKLRATCEHCDGISRDRDKGKF